MTKKPYLIIDNILYLSLQDLFPAHVPLSSEYASDVNNDIYKKTYYFSFSFGYYSIWYYPGYAAFEARDSVGFWGWSLLEPARLLYGDLMVPIGDISDSDFQYPIEGKNQKYVYLEYEFIGFENGFSRLQFSRNRRFAGG